MVTTHPRNTFLESLVEVEQRPRHDNVVVHWHQEWNSDAGKPNSYRKNEHGIKKNKLSGRKFLWPRSTLCQKYLKTEVSLWKHIQCFPSTLYLRRTNLETQHHRSFWIHIWVKLGHGNHMIIVASSVLKSFVLKMLSVCTKTQSRWSGPSKSTVLVTD